MVNGYAAQQRFLPNNRKTKPARRRIQYTERLLYDFRANSIAAQNSDPVFFSSLLLHFPSRLSFIVKRPLRRFSFLPAVPLTG